MTYREERVDLQELFNDYRDEIVAAEGTLPDYYRLLQGGDPQAALAGIQAAVARGDRHAQALGGLLLGMGWGTARNPGEAIRWLQPAAAGNELMAQTLLGMALVEGFGVAQDVETGLKWLHHAACQGHPTAIDAISVLMVDHPQLVGAQLTWKDMDELWLQADRYIARRH